MQPIRTYDLELYCPLLPSIGTVEMALKVNFLIVSTLYIAKPFNSTTSTNKRAYKKKNVCILQKLNRKLCIMYKIYIQREIHNIYSEVVAC